MAKTPLRASWIGWTVLFCLLSPSLLRGAEEGPVRLFSSAELQGEAPVYLEEERWRAVHVDPVGLKVLFESEDAIELELFDGRVVLATHRHRIHNASGSVSWIGDVSGEASGLVVLVSREGITLGSIRTGGSLYMLAYGGVDGTHILYEVDESLPRYQELPPTEVSLGDLRLGGKRAAPRQRPRDAQGLLGAQDDGSIHDLMVVYTPLALSEVGGVVAMENLIDLGVTETNLSYEASGIHHRLRLVYTAETDYDETTGGGDPRDLLQDPNDGIMDEVHGVRDQVAADLVKLIVGNAGGCGRAFIMNEVSVAFEEFAFCYTNHVCVSPGYTFQHELGHIQAGRHQRTGPVEDSPFPFNHGYTDPENQFRTIMAAGSSECPDGCPRRLAWSNPEVLDDETGAPMGIPEGDPLAADNRKTLNATAWVVANFRVSAAAIFADGFESGDLSGWSTMP